MGSGRRDRHRHRRAAGARLPERAIKVLAAGAFVVFGVLLVAEGLGLLPR